MSHFKNVLFVEYQNFAGEIGDSASFIYFYFHPIDPYKIIMYMSGDYNTNNNT